MLVFTKKFRYIFALVLVGLLSACKVTTESGVGGSISPESLEVPYKQTATFTVTPESGYAIESVTGCSGILEENLYVTGPITLDCTIVAEFKSLAADESKGIITLTGVSVEDFNSINSQIGFSISKAFFSTTPSEVQIYHNDWPVSESDVSYGADQILVNTPLREGRNSFLLVAMDTDGGQIQKEFVIWAGDHTLQGVVVDENQEIVTDATVIIKLGDDQSVMSQIATNNGQFSFSNLPDRTIILEASVDGQIIGSTAAHGGQGLIYLPTRSLYEASDVVNNDFSKGLDGWEIGNTKVWLVPDGDEWLKEMYGDITPTSAERRSHMFVPPNGTLTSVPTQISSEQKMNLVIGTYGKEGPSSVSRTFAISNSTKSVKVRYRFVTTEVPGGYFGSEYNDCFSVNIRSSGGTSVNVSNSMNGLGLGAFGVYGETAWREHSLDVANQQENNGNKVTVQVDITVSNVADEFLDSFIELSVIEETTINVKELKLNDIDNTNLNFLSASPHSYFNGETRINGKIVIEGSPDDKLTNLNLEILQGASVVKTVDLASGANALLIGKLFGEDGIIELHSSLLMFAFVPDSSIDYSKNGNLSLRLRIKSELAGEIIHDIGNVEILRKVEGISRYGDRDQSRGGDDWAKPSIAKLIEDNFSSLLWNDFSNMNGGDFTPDHITHRTGNEADGWFDGYNAMDASTATTMIDLINQAGSRIITVYMTYIDQPGNAFFDTINNVKLKDGRLVTNVIKKRPKHDTHFHWKIGN